jgi:hypothetical protein
MALTLTPAYVWADGDLVTSTRLNSTATPTIANGLTYAFGDGTAASPSITFNTDSDNGFYFVAANSFGIACGGASIGFFNTSGLQGCAIGATSASTAKFTTLVTTTTGAHVGLQAINSTAVTGQQWNFVSTDAGNCVIQQEGVVNALQLNFTTGNAIFSGSATIATGFGCNGKSAQTAAVSGGTVGGVITALIACGILSS